MEGGLGGGVDKCVSVWAVTTSQQWSRNVEALWTINKVTPFYKAKLSKRSITVRISAVCVPVVLYSSVLSCFC